MQKYTAIRFRYSDEIDLSNPNHMEWVNERIDKYSYMTVDGEVYYMFYESEPSITDVMNVVLEMGDGCAVVGFNLELEDTPIRDLEIVELSYIKDIPDNWNRATRKRIDEELEQSLGSVVDRARYALPKTAATRQKLAYVRDFEVWEEVDAEGWPTIDPIEWLKSHP